MSTGRETSRDRELVKHQHSFSSESSSRSYIPMWDSSDPERAPPPLPLNPGSPSMTTRPNTSALIANAAKALEEKARESMPSSYTTNPMPSRSPDRSLIKGAQHKRMQSLQTTSVRDLRSFLDGVRSPERSPERAHERSPERPSKQAVTPARDVEKDYFTGDVSPTRTGTPTPSGRDPLKDMPALRPSTRSTHRPPFLGENTPPSATMLALQTMTIPREHLEPPPLSNITNGGSRPSQTSQPLDGISSQLMGIANIVSDLQKEMTQLSRRSKDNASDLIGLKEATTTRDEDIRKSLKDLLSTMSHPPLHGTSADFLKDPHMTPTKQFTLPRVPSPSSFFMDERIGSPNPYSVEGAASVAMLEKIIREMVTKDGQERLLGSLQKLVDKATGDTAKKVSELVEFVKQGSASNALIHSAPPGSASFQPSPGTGPLTRSFAMPIVADGAKPYASPKAADFVSDEMLKFLRKIKDSVAEAGGVTVGTKSLVEELRSEVLAMGRELSRRIEDTVQAQGGQRAVESGAPAEDVSLIIQDGLANIKDHLDRVMRERRRQSTSSIMTRNTVDSQEVYGVVKDALTKRGLDQIAMQSAPFDKDAIITAVREAYESYSPKVEIQQFGLDRDEILQCLQEGLQEYRGSESMSKEEIMHTIQESIEHVKLPEPINESHEMREEILSAVRECLEEFKPAYIPQQQQTDTVSRQIVLDAVREALAGQDLTGPREIEISREDLQEAVMAGLQGTQLANQNNGEAVLQSLHSLVDEMHSEFKSYSSANGRDTEQVLDALRDGLDRLRAEIESYVDKAQDVTHKDEIVDTMRAELERLRNDVQGYIAEGTQRDHSEEMIAYIKTEFEQLQEAMGSQLALPQQDNEEILNALHAGFEGMKSHVVTRGRDLESDEEINEAMKREFDQLKDIVTVDTANNKDEIVEKLQAGFDGIHGRLDGQLTLATPNDEVLSTIKEEFEHLRETLGNSLVRSGGADKDDIIDAVRELIDGLRIHQGNELDQFKESLGSTLVPTTSNASNEELLESIKAGLEDLKSNSKTLGIDEQLLEALRGEMEQIRQSNGLTRQHTRADTEEVLESVRLGLDDLRSHLEKKLDNPERHMNVAGEVIDALNDGLRDLNADIAKMVDKPVDMTVSYEILDTLKDGLAGLREDMDKLKGLRTDSESQERELPTGNEVVLAEDPDQIISRDISSDSLRRNDLEKMEVMLAQLHVKVESMDANIQNPILTSESTATADTAVKNDLSSIEELLKDLQYAVLQLQDKEGTVPNVEGLASKEDTDAIETLLGNMKAKMEEIAIPDPATTVTKENLDDVELVVRTTAEAIEVLSKKIEEESASKGDVAVVQVIVDDIKNALDEMKASKPEDDAEATEKVTKTDVDSLALLVCDVKAKLDEMKIPDGDELPSKADMEQLTGLIHDFRDSHDKMKDSYESDIAITAKAFDDRKKEAECLVETMGDVKAALDDLKDDIKLNLIEGGPMEDLKESFKSLEDTIGVNFSITADVKELMETVSREFERAHGSIENLHASQEEKSALTLEKHDEAKDAIIAGLVEKIDDRFNTLMTKYDDAQLLADEQAKVMKEKAEEQERVLETTKAMADELKITIDTLGASITGMEERFEQATQRWANDSATVFGKIDDTIAKLEEHQLDGKTEHSHTRDEIANVERNFNGLHDNITEYHPKFMVTLREIEALVKQHYDHSQKAKEASDEQARAMAEEARSRAEQMQSHFSALPALLPAPPPAIEFPEKYNDAPVQEKLDKLLGHVEEAEKAEKSTSQLERLDEIHKQVLATAAEVSEFVTKQTQLITDGRESQEREAEELGLQVERRLAQKEHLEADIAALKAEKERVVQELKAEKALVMEELKDEKDRTIAEIKEEKDTLLSIVAALQVERENLANQKVRLTGEVSSLHTALDIRREELHFMDVKADALEQRILQGIMNHSRALMIAKGGSKSPSKLRKRTTAETSNEAGDMAPPPSMAANGLSLALKPRPAIRRNGAQPNPAGRRIHSLSQISGNAPPGTFTFLTPANKMANSGNLKRSHSVKTSYLRKTSWGGRPNVAETVAELDKENEILGEESETEHESRPTQLQIEDARSIAESHYDDDLASEDGTERRHSISNRSYADSYAEGETPSYDGRSSYGGAGSDYTYGSGSSYMTGSDIDRRTSYGSTAARSTLLGGADTIDEDSESDDGSHYGSGEDDDQTTTIPPADAPSETPESDDTVKPEEREENMQIAALQEEELEKPNLRIYAAPSDSGLGTDLATAGEGGMTEADYFRRAAEEESTVG